MKNIKSLWKGKKWIRTLTYILSLPILAMFGSLAYFLALTTFRFNYLPFKIISWGILFLAFTSLILVFFFLFKLYKELLWKKMLVFLAACYLFASLLTLTLTYQYGIAGLYVASYFPLSAIYELGYNLIFQVPLDIQFAITGKRDPVFAPGVEWKNGTAPTSIVVYAPSTFSYCKNIAFTTPYTIGQTGIVAIVTLGEEKSLYQGVPIRLYKSAQLSDESDISFDEGEKLTILEGPVPSEQSNYLFWKVGNENKEGWCLEEI